MLSPAGPGVQGVASPPQPIPILPTDLSARSRLKPEKSKKLRYSPATSLLNSLLPGEEEVSIRTVMANNRGVWTRGPRYLYFEPDLPNPLPLLPLLLLLVEL